MQACQETIATMATKFASHPFIKGSRASLRLPRGMPCNLAAIIDQTPRRGPLDFVANKNIKAIARMGTPALERATVAGEPMAWKFHGSPKFEIFPDLMYLGTVAIETYLSLLKHRKQSSICNDFLRMQR